MSDPAASNSTPFTVFDYLGLAFILGPPGIVVEALMKGEPLSWTHAIYGVPAVIIGAICIYIGRHWATLKDRVSISVANSIDKVNSYSYFLAIMAFAVFLILISLAPLYIWPPHAETTVVSTTLPSAADIADDVVSKLPKQVPIQIPSASDIAREVARQSPQNAGNQGQKVQELMTALTASNKSRDDLTQQLNALRNKVEPKSPRLGLDDTRRWELARQMLNSSGDGSACRATLNYMTSENTPETRKSTDTFGEAAEVLIMIGWQFTQNNNRILFPPGISIYVGTQSGQAFNCASRLKDYLESLGIEPVVIHTNESTPDLIACKNECIHVALGKISSP